MKLKISFRSRLIIIAFSGLAALVVVLAALFNMSGDLSVQEAEKRIRVYLTKEMSERLIQVNAEFPEGYEKQKILSQLAEELKKINAVEITSIEVKKLLPDIFIRPHRPTFIARVEMKTATKKFPPRFFWLPWTGIDTETTELAWQFAF